MTRFLLAAMMVLLVAACDTLPHPFAADRPKPSEPIFTLKDSASVAVAPIAGIAPAARDKLASAMAAALQDADILATSGGNVGDRLSLLGTARGGGGSVTIDWRLVDTTGKSVGQVTSSASVSLDAIDRGEAGALKTLATASAPPVAKLLQDETPTEAVVTPDFHRIVVRPVTGAPGDGKEALRLAMAAALTQAKLSVVPSTGDLSTALAVVGTVTLDPPKAGQQHIAINWRLLDAGGRQLGVVNQQNAVPQGSLDARWGEVANLVASAAAPGIIALIDKVQHSNPGS